MWARGGGGRRGRGARSRQPAVVRRELGRGAPTSAAGWQNPGERNGERGAGKRGGRASPHPHPTPRPLLGRPGPRAPPERARTVGRRDRRPSRAPAHPHPVPARPLGSQHLPVPPGAARARARRHLHFGDSAAGNCLHRAVESQSGKSATPRLWPAAQVKTAGLSGQEEGRAGIWVALGQRVKLTAAAAASHRHPLTQAPPPRADRSGWQTGREECPPSGRANPKQRE